MPYYLQQVRPGTVPRVLRPVVPSPAAERAAAERAAARLASILGRKQLRLAEAKRMVVWRGSPAVLAAVRAAPPLLEIGNDLLLNIVSTGLTSREIAVLACTCAALSTTAKSLACQVLVKRHDRARAAPKRRGEGPQPACTVLWRLEQKQSSWGVFVSTNYDAFLAAISAPVTSGLKAYWRLWAVLDRSAKYTSSASALLSWVTAALDSARRAKPALETAVGEVEVRVPAAPWPFARTACEEHHTLPLGGRSISQQVAVPSRNILTRPILYRPPGSPTQSSGGWSRWYGALAPAACRCPAPPRLIPSASP